MAVEEILNTLRQPINIELEEYRYRVQEGDTLTKIAREQDTRVEYLLLFNNPHLTKSSRGERRDQEGNWIHPGDEVVIFRKKRLISKLPKNNIYRNKLFGKPVYEFKKGMKIDTSGWSQEFKEKSKIKIKPE